MMRVLCVDTVGTSLGVAVADEGGALCEIVQRSERRHAQTLLPAIEDALRLAGVSLADIDLFAAVRGPGSFTGIRIGVSAVRGLAHATGKPCVGVCALEVLAAPYAGCGLTVCAMLDARNRQVYAAAYQSGQVALPARAGSVDDTLLALEPLGGALFVGDGATVNRALIEQAMPGGARFLSDRQSVSRPATAAMLALRDAPLAGPPDTLLPEYLRDSSAQRAREGEKV